MAIVGIDSIIAGFADRKRQKLEFIFRRPLLVDGRVFGPSGLIVSVDATTTESYQLTASITQNPVGAGATLSDHIHIRPQKLTIEGIITDKPLEVLQAVAQVPVRALLSSTARGLLGKILGGYEKHLAVAGTGLIQEKIIAPLLGTRATRKDVARLYWNNVLKARFNSKEPFSIRSEVGLIENCFFTSITWNRQQKHGDALFFNAIIQEVQTVQSDVVITPRFQQAQKKKGLGKINPRVIEQGVRGEVEKRVSRQIKQKAEENQHIFSKPNVIVKRGAKLYSGLKSKLKSGFGAIRGFFSR